MSKATQATKEGVTDLNFVIEPDLSKFFQSAKSTRNRCCVPSTDCFFKLFSWLGYSDAKELFYEIFYFIQLLRGGAGAGLIAPCRK